MSTLGPGPAVSTRAPGPTAVLLPLLSMLALWSFGPGVIGAQTLAPPIEGRTGGEVGRVHVEARPGSPVVGIALALPLGSAEDPDGGEGAARALAGVVARQVEATLGPGGGLARATVTPYRTTISVLATSGRLEDALQALLDAAFRRAPDAATTAAEFAELGEVLTFEAGAPILDVRRETHRLLYGSADPGSRPSEGTAAGLATLDVERLTAFQRTHYRPSESTLAIVGVDRVEPVLAMVGIVDLPVPDQAAVDSAGVEPGADPVAEAGPPADPAPQEAVGPPDYRGALPWTVGDRVRISQEVTSTWIAAAYPVPDDLPTTLLDFITLRLHEEFNPTPGDPGLFSARVEVRQVPGGRALLIEAAVLPDAADRWESQVLQVVEALARPAEESFFRWQRRRFRASVLLGEAAPETAALRQATDLLLTGGVRTLADAVWVLDAATLATGVAALGPPRILVYGPDLVGGGSPR
jgi:hypothetical protein